MLSVHHISLERYFEQVFKPVSFSVDAGKLLLVTGTNGSGKTTLVRILAGILRPSEGEFRFKGHNRVYLGHKPAIKDDLSVEENIEFMRDFGGRKDASPSEITQRLGLRRVASQPARTLSAGQRKRCALARLLFEHAGLWLLDEPYSNLDREGMAMLDSMLRAHLDAGGACIMTTHGSLRPEGFELDELELVSGAGLA